MIFILLNILAFVCASTPNYGNIKAKFQWPIFSQRECVIGSKSSKTASDGLKVDIYKEFSGYSDQEFYQGCVDECAAVPWCVAVEMNRQIDTNPIFHKCTLVTSLEILRAKSYFDYDEFLLSFRNISDKVIYNGFEFRWTDPFMELGPIPHIFENWVDPEDVNEELVDRRVLCVVNRYDTSININLEDVVSSSEVTQAPTQPMPSIKPKAWVGIVVGIVLAITLCALIFFLGGDEYQEL